MEKATFRTLCLVLLLTSTSVFSQGGNGFVGEVLYQNSYPLSGVTAYLHAPGGEIIATDTSDINGQYGFENLPDGNYTVTFETEQDAGGIELSDVYDLLYYFQDDIALTPIQALAANVNGDGDINMDDYNQILNGYLNQGNPFPTGSWVFETLSVTIPIQSRDGLSKSGSSSGDVNGSLVPDPKSNQIFTNNPTINLTSDPRKPIEFDLSGGQSIQIAGMHLVIEVPEGLEVISVNTPVIGASICIKENQIKVTWLDASMKGYDITESDPLVVINAKPTSLSRDGKSFSLRLGDQSHFMNLDGELISGVSLVLPTINLTLRNELTLSAYPNPFMDYATLDYQLPQDGQIMIALYDQSGRMVQEVENGAMTAGNHQAKIDGSLLLPGIYYYSIRFTGSDQYINTGAIIKSK